MILFSYIHNLHLAYLQQIFKVYNAHWKWNHYRDSKCMDQAVKLQYLEMLHLLCHSFSSWQNQCSYFVYFNNQITLLHGWSAALVIGMAKIMMWSSHANVIRLPYETSLSYISDRVLLVHTNRRGLFLLLFFTFLDHQSELF